MKGSSELRELIVRYFESFTVGDPDWVDRHVLNGPELRLIGTGHDEWLDGVGAFSVFQQEIPGMYFFLGGNPEGVTPEEAAPHHSPYFFFDEGAMPVGVRALAHLVVDYVTGER